MSGEATTRGLIDTNIVVHLAALDPVLLPDEMVCAAVLAPGRTPGRRVADLMIASVAAANRLPLYTTNPDDFIGLDQLVKVVAIPRPPGP